MDEKGNLLKNGEYGELVITTLGVETMPLIRFKTGDICCIHEEKCSCGRTTPRLSPILGRKKHMIKYKGTTIFPDALYEILDHVPDVKNYQIEVFTNSIGTDDVLVKIGSLVPSEKLEKEIKDHCRAKLRVALTLEFVEPDTLQKLILPPTSRKPVKFIDKRVITK